MNPRERQRQRVHHVMRDILAEEESQRPSDLRSIMHEVMDAEQPHPAASEITDLYRRLDAEGQRQLRAFAEFLAQRHQRQTQR